MTTCIGCKFVSAVNEPVGDFKPSLNLRRDCYSVVASTPEWCSVDQLQYLPAHLLEELVPYLNPASLIRLSPLLKEHGVPMQHAWSERFLQVFAKHDLLEKLQAKCCQHWAAFTMDDDYYDNQKWFLSLLLTRCHDELYHTAKKWKPHRSMEGKPCHNSGDFQHYISHISTLKIMWSHLSRFLTQNTDNVSQILHDNLVDLCIFLRNKDIEDETVVDFTISAVRKGRLKGLRLKLLRHNDNSNTINALIKIVDGIVALEKSSGRGSFQPSKNVDMGEVIMNMDALISSQFNKHSLPSQRSVITPPNGFDTANCVSMDDNFESDSQAVNSSNRLPDDEQEIDLFDEAVTNVTSNRIVDYEMACIQGVIKHLTEIQTDSCRKSGNAQDDAQEILEEDLSEKGTSLEHHRVNEILRKDKNTKEHTTVEFNERVDSTLQDAVRGFAQDRPVSDGNEVGETGAACLESFSLTKNDTWLQFPEEFKLFKQLMAQWQSLSRLSLQLHAVDFECLANMIAVKVGCRQLTHLAIGLYDGEVATTAFSKLLMILFENYREDSGVNQPMEYFGMMQFSGVSGPSLTVDQYNCDLLAVKQFELNDCRLGSVDPANLVHFLSHNKCLTHLNMKSVSLSELADTQTPSVVAVLNCISSSSILETLVLDTLELLDTDEFDAALVTLVENDPSLHHLVLACCSPAHGYTPSKQLQQAIVNHKNIRFVSLQGNNMSQGGAEFLYKCMVNTGHSNIRSLDLRNCLIHGEDLIQVIKELNSNSKMKQPFHVLDISMNLISAAEQGALIDLVQDRMNDARVEIGGNEHAEFVAQM